LSGGLTSLVGLTFASDGLLRSDYTRKPSFTVYRSLISTLGARSRRHQRKHRLR
jgi:hypothetical protein